MKTQRRFINQFMAGETLDQVFLVKQKDLRSAKNSGLYIVCTLADKTGQMPARMWQASEPLFNSLPADGFLHVKGRTDEYKGSLQIIIDACRPYPADKLDMADFVPVTQLDTEAMWNELLDIMRAIQDQHLRMLIKKFVEDQQLVAAFKRSPAAMELHHPFIGGLLEHTLGVARAAKALLPLYPKINSDLVLAGVFLHDIGKTAELTAGTAMQYTDRGQLVGHITIAAIWIGEKAAAMADELGEPFPPKTLDLLQHIVLSHHGQPEFGAAKPPMIPEAFVVHYLDNLDAKVWMTSHQIETDPDQASSFTAYNKHLGTRLYKLSAKPQNENSDPA